MLWSSYFRIGRYRRVGTAAAGAILCLLAVSKAGAQSTPPVVELAYDDGSPVAGLDLADASLFAMRFSPPSSPARLLEVKYYLTDTTYGTGFYLFVHDDNDGEPANVLYGPLHVEGGHVGWNSVDLREDSIIVERDFHVAIGLDGQSIVQIGAENIPPITGRANLGDCCGWWRWSEGDFLIRAVVELQPAGVSGKGRPLVPQASLVVFPNPSHGEVLIHIERSGWRPVALSVVDLTGRTVARWRFLPGKTALQFRWEAQDDRGRALPSGVYFLLAADARGTRIIRRITLIR